MPSRWPRLQPIRSYRQCWHHARRLYGSRTESTLPSCAGLLPSQSFCGERRILAPLAPPRLSEPLKVEALAHAVSTISAMDRPLDLMASYRLYVIVAGPLVYWVLPDEVLVWYIGPRYLVLGPMSL